MPGWPSDQVTQRFSLKGGAKVAKKKAAAKKAAAPKKAAAKKAAAKKK
mgnify:CR=1